MKRLAVLAVAVMLCGCATHYERRGGDMSNFDKDARECVYDVERATAGIPNLGVQIGERANLQASCMASRGYSQRFN